MCIASYIFGKGRGARQCDFDLKHKELEKEYFAIYWKKTVLIVFNKSEKENNYCCLHEQSLLPTSRFPHNLIPDMLMPIYTELKQQSFPLIEPKPETTPNMPYHFHPLSQVQHPQFPTECPPLPPVYTFLRHASLSPVFCIFFIFVTLCVRHFSHV